MSDPLGRVERDALGAVGVPDDVLWGVHTARALTNFTVSGVTAAAEPDLVRALGWVKAAAARANRASGALEPSIAEAIVAAAREVAADEHTVQFPIDLVHGGGGTALNMNANEVIANRANELLGQPRGRYQPVHPNDHVNRSQSTNDVFPTAIALATTVVGARASKQLGGLVAAFTAKACEYDGRERLGRTCLQDAVPLTIGDTHRAQAHAISRTRSALDRSLEPLLAVPLGATAVGTGIGAPNGYRERVIPLLAEESGLDVRAADDLFDSLANLDGYLDVAAQLLRCVLVMAKVAADLRFLSSAAVGEVSLPAVQVGSSIMPGKVNPVIPELVMQVSYEIRGVAATVEAAVAAGELELNVMEPVIARHLLAGLRDAGRVAELFRTRCVDGLRWNDAALTRNLSGSRAAAVELAVERGYAHAADPTALADGYLGLDR